jgi:hypothetical protein
MTPRITRLLFAASLASMLLGCGGGDEKTETSANATALSGRYRARTEGSIAIIVFGDERRYELAPTGCAESSCVEAGTYRIVDDDTRLVLEDVVTHLTRSVPFRVLEESQAGLTTSGLRAKGLVNGGGQLTNGGGSLAEGDGSLVTGGEGLTKGGGALVSTVESFVLDGQELVRAVE